MSSIFVCLFYNLLSKSTGLDGIPARFLRDAADIIAPTVTFIFNISSKKGIVPSDTNIGFIDGFNGNSINKRYCACACLCP